MAFDPNAAPIDAAPPAAPVTSGFHPDAPDTAPLGKTASPALVGARNALKDIPALPNGIQPNTNDIGLGSTIANGAQNIVHLAKRLLDASPHARQFIEQGRKDVGNPPFDESVRNFEHGAFQVAPDTEKAMDEDPAASRGRLEGGSFPYVLGGAPSMAVAKTATSAIPRVGAWLAKSPVAANITNSAVAGAGMANVGDPAHAGWDATKSGAEWGAAIPAAAHTLGTLAGGALKAADPYYQQAVDILHKYGIPTDLAQATGKFQNIRRYFTANPGSAGVMDDARADAQRAYTAAEMHNTGETGSYFDPKVVLDRIGGDLDKVESRINLQLTPQGTGVVPYGTAPGQVSPGQAFDASLRSLEANAPAATHIDNIPPVARNIEALRSAAAANNGVVPGVVVQQVMSNLRGLSREGNNMAEDLKHIVDAHLDSQLGNTDIGQTWRTLNGQYKNAMVMRGAQSTGLEGMINPRGVTNGLKNKYNVNRNSPSSEDPFVQVARATSHVADKFPDSGTGRREAIQQAITGLLHPAIGTAIGAYEDPDHREGAAYGALTGLLSLGAAKYGAKAFTSPTVVNYLTRGPQGNLSRAMSGMAGLPGEAVMSNAGPLSALTGAAREANKPQDDSYQY